MCRKWAKSTLVLMPLFGVHYTVYAVMHGAEMSEAVEVALLFIDQLFTSFQVKQQQRTTLIPLLLVMYLYRRLGFPCVAFVLSSKWRSPGRGCSAMETIQTKPQPGESLVAVQHYQPLEVRK